MLEEFLHSFGSTLSQGSFIAPGVAFLAGIVTNAICPCTLPVGLGMASVVGASETKSRWSGFTIAISFFAGIIINLAILGTLAGYLGAILHDESFGRYWTFAMALISFVGAIIAFRGPRLKIDQLMALRKPGSIGAFGYGFIFSLGTSTAPLLLLLTVAATQGRPEYGLVLAFSFGLGRGLPFLIVGLFTSAVLHLCRVSSRGRAIEIASGIALLLVSAYYVQVFVALF